MCADEEDASLTAADAEKRRVAPSHVDPRDVTHLAVESENNRPQADASNDEPSEAAFSLKL